jgi:hypothetical protein
MSIPHSGTYRIRNVKYPNQMFDLNGGSASAGTPVIGYANNTKSQNMLVSVDSLAQNHRLTISIVDLASARCEQQDHQADQRRKWHICPRCRFRK